MLYSRTFSIHRALPLYTVPLYIVPLYTGPLLFPPKFTSSCIAWQYQTLHAYKDIMGFMRRLTGLRLFKRIILIPQYLYTFFFLYRELFVSPERPGGRYIKVSLYNMYHEHASLINYIIMNGLSINKSISCMSG